MNNTNLPQTQREGKLLTLDFHGAPLILVEHDGQPYVAMKNVVEGMGLDWSAQRKKLVEPRWQGMAITAIPSPGGPQDAFCIPLRKLPAWLSSIQLRRIALDLQPRVAKYQDECDDALWNYWTKGHAVNPRASQPFRVPQTLSEALRLAADLEEQRQTLSCKVAEQADDIAVLEPKAAVADALACAEGALTVGDAGQSLGLGRNRLFTILVEWGWAYRSRDHVVPYQNYVDNGYLQNKVYDYEDRNGVGRVGSRVYVTGRGYTAIQMRMHADGQRSLIRPQHMGRG